jgi:apolipoprotein D and lipocalin family protein
MTKLFLAMTAIVLLFDCNEGPATLQALRLAPSVDLNRYAGRWYEIARLPNRFQQQCAGGVTADYTLRKDGRIDVVNRCRTTKGETEKAAGVARLADKSQPTSMLKVRFAPAFLSFLPQVWGDYQIMVLAEDYSYAMVGTPDRKYLWILARSPQLAEASYAHLVSEAAVQGFKVSNIERTVHP